MLPTRIPFLMFRRRLHKSLKGFTLAEVLVASSLSFLLIGCVYRLYWDAFKPAKIREAEARQDQLALLLLERVQHDLGRTSFNGCRAKDSDFWLRLLGKPTSNGTPWQELVGYRLNGKHSIERFVLAAPADTATAFPDSLDLETVWNQRGQVCLSGIASMGLEAQEKAAVVTIKLQNQRVYQCQQAFTL